MRVRTSGSRNSRGVRPTSWQDPSGCENYSARAAAADGAPRERPVDGEVDIGGRRAGRCTHQRRTDVELVDGPLAVPALHSMHRDRPVARRDECVRAEAEGPRRRRPRAAHPLRAAPVPGRVSGSVIGEAGRSNPSTPYSSTSQSSVDAGRATIGAHRLSPHAPQHVSTVDVVMERVAAMPRIDVGRPVESLLQFSKFVLPISGPLQRRGAE